MIKNNVSDLDTSGKHFAEGSSHNEDKPESGSEPFKKSQLDGREHGPVDVSSKDISQIHSDKSVNINNDGAKLNNNSFTSSINESSLPKKLNDNVNSDLILGMPEVNHTDGISSVKARKGVSSMDIPIVDDASSNGTLSRIVPRKGVPSDNSLPVNNNCFKTSNNTCFNVTKFRDLDCSCCNGSNNSQEVAISPENSANCSSCRPIDDILVDASLSCNKVCCKNKTLDSNKLINQSISGLEIVSNVTKNETGPHKKKHKPTITREPVDNSDAENSTSSTFPSKKAVIPIVVSLFILPLISILAFFAYKKTKDYWDKRYYKRMDFLIDGMYND